MKRSKPLIDSMPAIICQPHGREDCEDCMGRSQVKTKKTSTALPQTVADLTPAPSKRNIKITCTGAKGLIVKLQGLRAHAVTLDTDHSVARPQKIFSFPLDNVIYR